MRGRDGEPPAQPVLGKDAAELGAWKPHLPGWPVHVTLCCAPQSRVSLKAPLSCPPVPIPIKYSCFNLHLCLSLRVGMLRFPRCGPLKTSLGPRCLWPFLGKEEHTAYWVSF